MPQSQWRKGQVKTNHDPAKANRRTPSDAAVDAKYARLHDEDIERIANAVVQAMRRERFVDDVARSLRQRLDET